jgi:DNA-binding NtrC family response regulator
VSQTARLLNLQRTTLIEKLNKYDLRQASLPVASTDNEKLAE